MKEKLKNITTVFCLIDGVISTGEFFVLPGNELDFIRGIHKRDGVGLDIAIRAGIKLVFITGHDTQLLTYKLNNLGVEAVITGSRNRKEDIKRYCAKRNISLDEVMFIGDDLPDFNAMDTVGVSACPSSAIPAIKQVSAYVSKASGGQGCLREIMEELLKAKEIDVRKIYN